MPGIVKPMKSNVFTKRRKQISQNICREYDNNNNTFYFYTALKGTSKYTTIQYKCKDSDSQKNKT